MRGGSGMANSCESKAYVIRIVAAIVSVFEFVRRTALLAESKSPLNVSKSQGRTRETFRTG